MAVLTEAEAESRLAALRRERAALDRAITDLTLYLELGRRLQGGPSSPVSSGIDASPSAASPNVADDSPPAARDGSARVRSAQTIADASSRRPDMPSGQDRDGAAGSTLAPRASGSPAPVAAISVSDGISEGALARRYGRALIREAVVVLEKAGRPLHASEILSALTARGFTVPGQQDPVAALNTRLWKRATSGGPLRRLGDAIYAPAENTTQSDSDQA